MRVLGRVEVADVLAEWGEHEVAGFLVAEGKAEPGYLNQFGGLRRRHEAIMAILQVRAPVIAAILMAKPTEWVAVELSKADLPSIRVMDAKPLADHGKSKLAEAGKSGDWVRRLVAGPNVAGPMLAIARTLDGPITLLDGLHRMAGWVGHLNAGRDYAVKVTVVVTKEAAPAFELAP